MKRPAVFLDRDGTINYDPGYLDSPDKLVVLPPARRGLKLLSELGYPLFIVTNQSGIGRGFLSVETLQAIHRRLEDELAPAGIGFEEIAFCPHRPEEGCSCRKPSPKMVLDLAAAHDIDLAASYLIGDSPSDIETGRRAGCRTVLLSGPAGREGGAGGPVEPDYSAADLWEAARLIRELAAAGREGRPR